MVFEPICKFGQFWNKMIVGDSTPGLLPDMFLGVQVGSSGWELDDLKTGIGSQQITDGIAAMPGSTIPEQEDGTIRIVIQNLLQVLWADTVALNVGVRVTISSPVCRFNVP